MSLEGIVEKVPIEESDCCGNGCANCVLDIKPKFIEHNSLNKRNIILNYIKFQLVAKDFYEKLSDVLELHFKWYDDSSMYNSEDLILDIPPGHHIMLRFKGNDEDTKKIILRPYSPFWTNALEFEFKILVNLKPQGAATKFLDNVLEVGMKAEFRGPIGTFQLDKIPSNSFLCIITQGVGIAPTIPIIEKVLESEDDETRIWHFICATDLKHIYFRKRLLKFSTFWNYKNTIYVAHEPCEHNPKVCEFDECKCFPKKLHYKELAYARKLNTEDIVNVFEKYESFTNICIIAGTREFQNSIANIMKTLRIVRDENLYLL